MGTSTQKIRMVRSLTRTTAHGTKAPGLRVMSREDIPHLGRLFLSAYVGTVDYEGESEKDAIAVVQSTFDGEFGKFLGQASVVMERKDELVSASFITLWDRQPLLAFSVTAPAHKGSGFAGECITASMQVLAHAAYKELNLFVTTTNAPALSVYRRLGFSVASAS